MMFAIAWRNLWRNRTRTIVSISAISFSYGLFLVTLGIADSSYSKMEDAAAKSAGGSVLVHADGYWDSKLNDKVMSNGEELASKLREIPGSDGVSRRVLINGLLSTSSGNIATLVQGVDPVEDSRVQNAGQFLSKGTFLTGEEKDPLVIGTEAAKELNVELGDRVVLTTTDPSGEMTRALFHVTGFIHTGSKQMDKMAAYTSLSAAQKAANMPGQFTQIGLIAPREARHEVKAAALKALDSKDFEVMTWDEAMPEIVSLIQMDAAFGDIYGIVVFLVVMFAVLNTFLMIVMERIREFGLLSALGLQPHQVSLLLFYESLLLAIVSMILGFALGFSIHYYFAVNGLDLTSIYGDMEMGGVVMNDMFIRSEINVSRWVGASLSVFFLTMLSSVYPAYRASKLTPADAMRFFH